MGHKEEITNLMEEGVSQAEISRILGVSRQRVGQIFKGYKNLGNTIRKSILTRDNNKCQWGEMCNDEKKVKLNVHHIDLNSKNNKKDNLITLCSKCHAHFHKKEIDKKLIKIDGEMHGFSLFDI